MIGLAIHPAPPLRQPPQSLALWVWLIVALCAVLAAGLYLASRR